MCSDNFHTYLSASTSVANTSIIISHEAHVTIQHTTPSGRCHQLARTLHLKRPSGNNNQEFLWLQWCHQSQHSECSPPPNDMIIRFRERQYYKDPFTRELNYTAAEENTHYHFSLSCIQKKQSSFEPAKLVTPRDISLTFVHVACLLDEFGIRVWQYCKAFTCTISTLSLHGNTIRLLFHLKYNQYIMDIPHSPFSIPLLPFHSQ